MLKKISDLLPHAMNAVKDKLESGGTVAKGYQGAISGLGTSILQMGILPTLAVYADADNEADIDRKKLMEAVQFIVSKSGKYNTQKGFSPQHTLFDEALAQHKDKIKMTELKHRVIDATVALKLAIRTFKLV
jgi:CRISPR-associated protein (Cas_Cmr5)